MATMSSTSPAIKKQIAQIGLKLAEIHQNDYINFKDQIKTALEHANLCRYYFEKEPPSLR